MKKRFPSITLLSLVTTLKFTHEILQNNLLQCKFFSQHLTSIKALTFWLSASLYFAISPGVGGGGIDLNNECYVCMDMYIF